MTGTHRGPALLALTLTGSALAVSLAVFGPSVGSALAPVPGYDPERMVLLYSSLPRLVTSLLCGAALAASGAILQQVLRNPLASPTTLGISAGANLALALATLIAPALLGLGRDAVALAGGAATALIVFGLARRRGFAPLSLVLAGLVVGLYCGALSAVLVLLNDRYLVSLFIWGGGSLAQQDWSVPRELGLRLAVLALPTAFLARPLTLLDIEDDGARSLGLPVARLRVAAVAVAVALAAFVTSAVGVIGFIGLIAPTLARLAGARRFRERLVWSPVIGAALLCLTDGAVQLLAGVSGDLVPTGAVAALFGSPFLLVLLPLLRTGDRPPSDPFPAQPRRPPPRAVLLALGGALVLFTALSLALGRGPEGGWRLIAASDVDTLMPWRAPRMVAALAAGAMLAVAGTIMQRLTGNAMASPEVLGIGAGAALGVAVALFGLGASGPVAQVLAAAAGALLVLLAILALGRRSGFAPERVLLAGIALGALLDAVVGALSAGGDPRAFLLLSWMSGSTNGVGEAKAAATVAAAIVLIALAFTVHRWLGVLPLGSAASRALGLDLGRSRPYLLLLAAALTAVATLVVGPLSFVGLMAPHLAHGLGLRRASHHLPGAALAGAGVMVAADWTARVIAFPYQLPTGLVAALVGAPFLLWLLHRNGARG